MNREDERQAGERRDRSEILGEVERELGADDRIVTFDEVPIYSV
jgi:hypothetical protein